MEKLIRKCKCIVNKKTEKPCTVNCYKYCNSKVNIGTANNPIYVPIEKCDCAISIN